MHITNLWYSKLQPVEFYEQTHWDLHQIAPDFSPMLPWVDVIKVIFNRMCDSNKVSKLVSIHTIETPKSIPWPKSDADYNCVRTISAT